MTKTVAPYGSWASPIAPETVASESVRLSEVRAYGEELFWIERRPSENGRNVIVSRRADGSIVDWLEPPRNSRTLVHEYGGGSYTVDDGRLYFVNFSDQDLYRCDAPGAVPERLTELDGIRLADLCCDPRRDRILAVAEDHRAEGEPRNYVAAIDLASGRLQVLVEGDDFYSGPTVDAAGVRLAWLSWNHPDMPWDATALYVAVLDDEGLPRHPRQVAGDGGESIFLPRFSPTGEILFVSDRTGWWNLYRDLDLDDDPRGTGAGPACTVDALAPMEAEAGLPQWVFGMSTYDVLDDGRIALAYRGGQGWALGLLDEGGLSPCPVPFDEIDSVTASGGRVAFIGASPSRAPAVIAYDPATSSATIVRASSEAGMDAAWVSLPRRVSFACEGGETGHAFFYPPRNPDFEGPPDDRPMLLVLSHGGPTASASCGLSPAIQYWTSRGFAVVDVDYRGSTGYGSRYRRALRGCWGVADVDDCVACALSLARDGEVDVERLAIRGGSAGGYTTLSALTFRDVFKAGASYYGIGDLEALARDTHKFESRYLDRLIGPYPAARDVYVERSPVNFPEKLSCPTIFFQGLEDKVVPPTQAEAMVEALRTRSIPVACVAFPDEQHGFRRAENICTALSAELYFYSRVFGFVPAEALEPIPIDNEEEL